MRRLAFALTILTLFILLILLNLPPKILSSSDQLSQFLPNQKLLVQGQVIKETYTKNYKLITLETFNNTQLKCPLSCPALINKNISALTSLEYYNNKYYLKILKIIQE